MLRFSTPPVPRPPFGPRALSIRSLRIPGPGRMLGIGLLLLCLYASTAWAEVCGSPTTESAPGRAIACDDTFVYDTADAFPLLLDVLANDRQTAGQPLGLPELISMPGADAAVRADGSITVSLLTGVESTEIRYRLGDPQGVNSEAVVEVRQGNKLPTGSGLEIGTFHLVMAGGDDGPIHFDTDLKPLWPDPGLCWVSFENTTALGGTVNLVDFIDPCQLDGAVRFHYWAPNAEGIDTFTYVVRDAAGVEGTGLVEIQLSGLAPPEPMFASWCDPDPSLTCHFDGSSSDDGAGAPLPASALEWDFGDGSPVVTGQLTTSHTFAADGVYEIRLGATDPATAIEATESRLLVVGNAVPSISASYTCGGGYDCVFDSSLVGLAQGTEYELSFDLRSVSDPAYPADAESGNCGGYWCRYQEGTATTLDATLPGPGFYGLHIILHPAEGQSWPGGTVSQDTIYFTITADQPPTATFEATPSPSDPLTVYFDASGSTDDHGPLDFLWDIDGSTAFGPTVIVTFPAGNSTYPVCVAVSDGVNPDVTTCQDISIQ